MDRIQPPPNYYGAPYPPGSDMAHTNYAPPPAMQNPGYVQSPRQENNNSNDGGLQPIETTEYFTKYMKGSISKRVKIYCSFTDSAEWHDKVFSGLVYAAGDEFIIIYDDKEKKHILILAVYILFIEFSDIKNIEKQ